MVVLREMLKEEYPAYCDYFIADYSREIAENYGHTTDVSIELAKAALSQNFPNDLERNEHSLFCIDAKIASQLIVVGYLWHSVDVEDQCSFIFDFYIADEYRGQGIGRQAMTLLENQLQQQGIKQIKLRVAFNNKRAVKLYQEIGFSITGFNMSKLIDKVP